MYDHTAILEQIFDNGYATTTFDLIPDKLSVTIKNLSGEDYIKMDDLMIDQKGSKVKIFQLYGIHKLGFALLKYKNKTFAIDNEKREEEAFKLLSKLASPLVDKMLKEQLAFEKEVKTALQMDEVDESFFDGAVSQQKVEPQVEA